MNVLGGNLLGTGVSRIQRIRKSNLWRAHVENPSRVFRLLSFGNSEEADPSNRCTRPANGGMAKKNERNKKTDSPSTVHRLPYRRGAALSRKSQI
jgi:hypothetical protein